VLDGRLAFPDPPVVGRARTRTLHATRFPTYSRARFNFMLDHVSVLLMKNRLLKADFGPLLNRASLLCVLAFAVMATAFRCSADRFRCYRLTAKTTLKALTQNRNISGKSAEKARKNFLSLFFRCYGPNNRESGGHPRSRRNLRRHRTRLEQRVLEGDAKLSV
jgi:hypothetical protein